ncbi:MAG: NDP-sugar synthase [Candidatus Promineofilum sp.]|nr:NDP-sugar synthase [Promineifilum sp.]
MKVVILMGGYGTRMRPHSWSRPKPVLQVGNNTVIGHILDSMAAVATEEVILVVGYKGEQIERWVREHYGHLDLRFVYQDEPLGQAHALWLCGDLLDEGEVVVSLGDIIIDADFQTIADGDMPAGAPPADAVFQTMVIDDPRHFGCLTVGPDGFVDRIVEKPQTGDYRLALAGAYWFRNGRLLWNTLEQTLSSGRQTNGEYFLADTFQIMLERGDSIGTQAIRSIVDIGSPANRLDANRRILERHASRLGQPRSMGDTVTIVPPVYVHPSASIEAAVIGPHVTIGRAAHIRRAVIADSIIEAGATISDYVLHGSIIGENVVLEGVTQALILGDDSRLTSPGR